jgi:metal-responsive CopG/Arc/MetJ family transcriptional regulator
MKKTEPRLKRITINIPTKLYNEITTLANENGLNFTSQTISILRNGIDQDTAVKTLPTIIEHLLNEQEKAIKKKSK